MRFRVLLIIPIILLSLVPLGAVGGSRITLSATETYGSAILELPAGGSATVTVDVPYGSWDLYVIWNVDWASTVKVELRRPAGVTFRAFTGGSGSFHVPRPEPGAWRLRVTSLAPKTVRVEVVAAVVIPRKWAPTVRVPRAIPPVPGDVSTIGVTLWSPPAPWNYSTTPRTEPVPVPLVTLTPSERVAVPGKGIVYGYSGPHLYAYYMHRWTDIQASYREGDWITLLMYADKTQWFWLYDQLPNGTTRVRSLGELGRGYYKYWLRGEGGGWHVLAVWGSESGWSNVVHVYVSPTAWPAPPATPPRSIPPLPGGPEALGINVSAPPPAWEVGEKPTVGLAAAREVKVRPSAVVGVPGRGLAGVTGVYPPPTIHLYAYYFDRWVDVQAGYYDNSWVKLLIHCGRPQWVWLYEQYPNGTVTYRPLGYVTSGYYFYWTQVQGVGWHLMALWGSADGWSNLLYVYVWPRAPPPPPPSAFTVRVWSDKTSYRSGEGINIYVYVNQPAVVHLTVEGPGVLKRVIKWLHEPGTHLFITGVAGPPGWRTVTAKAWTRAGDYAECEYKYYVSP